MKVRVELVYEGERRRRPKKVVVEVNDFFKGNRLFNAIDKAVMKAHGDDKEWKRWNLLGIDE